MVASAADNNTELEEEEEEEEEEEIEAEAEEAEAEVDDKIDCDDLCAWLILPVWGSKRG